MMQGCAATEPAPAPPPLPEGCQVCRPGVRPQLHVPWRGQRRAGRPQLIPCRRRRA